MRRAKLIALVLIAASAGGNVAGATPDLAPSWLGYSVGRWEGDALVVETIGLQNEGWLDAIGHPHSDALHMTERFRRSDRGHMTIEVTLRDPKAYSAPVSFIQPQKLLR